jgi:hypothetical protein
MIRLIVKQGGHIVFSEAGGASTPKMFRRSTAHGKLFDFSSTSKAFDTLTRLPLPTDESLMGGSFVPYWSASPHPCLATSSTINQILGSHQPSLSLTSQSCAALMHVFTVFIAIKRALTTLLKFPGTKIRLGQHSFTEQGEAFEQAFNDNFNLKQAYDDCTAAMQILLAPSSPAYLPSTDLFSLLGIHPTVFRPDALLAKLRAASSFGRSLPYAAPLDLTKRDLYHLVSRDLVDPAELLTFLEAEGYSDQEIEAFASELANCSKRVEDVEEFVGTLDEAAVGEALRRGL